MTSTYRPRARAGAAGSFRVLVLALLVAAAGLLPAGFGSAAAASAAGRGQPEPAGLPAAGQVIVVTAASRTTTYATLRVYRVSGGRRVRVAGPWTARVGYNGVAPPGAKREGDGRTPSGTYGFSFFFGVQQNLGFSFPFRHAYTYDVWDDDPASVLYNEWVDKRVHNPGANPEPMHNVPAYDYAAVIAYNTARVPGLGSAVFLHVGTGGATGGCVSLPRAELIRILRWLRPREHPQIIISAR
jgi:L,D-peptidoglycan transpeptidase YkuD (ErfK/YbiS/YcfS/YnhG family)